jgi:hypothetical protein
MGELDRIVAEHAAEVARKVRLSVEAERIIEELKLKRQILGEHLGGRNARPNDPLYPLGDLVDLPRPLPIAPGSAVLAPRAPDHDPDRGRPPARS